MNLRKSATRPSLNTQNLVVKDYGLKESKSIANMMIKKISEGQFQQSQPNYLLKKKDKTSLSEANIKLERLINLTSNDNGLADEYLLKSKIKPKEKKKKKQGLPQQQRPTSSKVTQLVSPKLQKVYYCISKNQDQKLKTGERLSDLSRHKNMNTNHLSGPSIRSSQDNYERNENKSNKSGKIGSTEITEKKSKKKGKFSNGKEEDRRSSSRSIDGKNKELASNKFEISDYFFERGSTKERAGKVGQAKRALTRKDEERTNAALIIQEKFRQWIRSRSQFKVGSMTQKTAQFTHTHSVEVRKGDKSLNFHSDSSKKQNSKHNHIIKQNGEFNSQKPQENRAKLDSHSKKKNAIILTDLEPKYGVSIPREFEGKVEIQSSPTLAKLIKPLQIHTKGDKFPVKNSEDPQRKSTTSNSSSNNNRQKNPKEDLPYRKIFGQTGREMRETNTISSKNFSKGSSFKAESPRGPFPITKAQLLDQVGWSNFAKEEYKKWGRVKNMLCNIEKSLGNRAAEEVKNLIEQLELFAENSKKTVKEAFLANDSCLTVLASDGKSVRQDLSLRGSACFERKIAVKGPAINGISLRQSLLEEGDPGRLVTGESQGLESPLESKRGFVSKRGSKDLLERWVEPVLPASTHMTVSEKVLSSM